MTGGIIFRRDNNKKKKAKFIKRYRRKEVVEIHDCLYPEGKRHIEEVISILV